MTARSIRTVDLAAILGPMEFVVCLVHCDRAGSAIALTRLVKALDGYEPSTGVALYPEDNCEPKQLIELARSRARHSLSRAA